MSLAGKSLCVLTPMYNSQLFMNYHESMLELVGLAPKSGMKSFSHVSVASSLLALGRNVLTQKFLETDATHAVFIDADMGFDPQDVLRMMELDRDVVGGCYPAKDFSWNRVQQICKRSRRDFTNEELQQLAAGTLNFVTPPLQAGMRLDVPQEVEQVGAGMLMVKREVFEKLRQAHPERWFHSRSRHNGAPLFGGGRMYDFFRQGVNAENEYFGEDYTFCNDCRAIGYKIWMCPWTKMTHMGTHAFVGDFPATARLCSESAKGRQG